MANRHDAVGDLPYWQRRGKGRPAAALLRLCRSCAWTAVALLAYGFAVSSIALWLYTGVFAAAGAAGGGAGEGAGVRLLTTPRGCLGCHPTTLDAAWPVGAIQPSFFIVGARRAATTSLFHYLSQHPQLRMPSRKAPQFFDVFYDAGFGQYATVFPTVPAGGSAVGQALPLFSGEASSTYLASCAAPARLHAAVPDAKVVVVLRDPVARLQSAMLAMERSPRALGAEFLLDERGQLAADVDARWRAKLTEELRALEACHARNPPSLWPWTCHCRPSPPTALAAHTELTSLIVDGLYESHLRRWLAQFPPSQVLVIHSDALDTRPLPVLRSIETFLGVRPLEYDPEMLGARLNGRSATQRKSVPLAEQADSLRALYQQYNRGLDELLTLVGHPSR